MKSIIITIFTFCGLLPVLAQTTTRSDSLLNRTMTLEKEYSATIRDAVKLSQLPALREPQAIKSAVEYSNYATPFNIKPKLIPLDPKAYLTHLHYSPYRGYITGGINSLIDLDADLGYQILNTDIDRLNIFFSHRSSRSDVSYLQLDSKQKFKINDNWGGLNFMHDFSKIKFLADAKYTYSAFNYYGLSIPSPYFGIGEILEPDSYFDKNTNQVNQLFEANLGVSSEEANELNYKLNIGYTRFQQKYGNSIAENGSGESRFLIDGNIFKMFNATMGIGLSGAIKTYSYSNSAFKTLNDSTTNYLVYSLNPYFYIENNKLNLSIGIKMDVEIRGRGKVTGSPTLKLNYNMDNQFLLYLLAESGRNDNSQYNLFYENRYIDPLIRVMDSRSPLDATAGIKFLPLPTFSVGIFGGYKITKDEHFYYSNYGTKNQYSEYAPSLSGNWITPVYENANTTKIGGDIQYAYQNTFELALKGTYYRWDIATNNYLYDAVPRKAWNKPDFVLNINAGYRLWFPLRFDLSYLGAYGRKAAGEPFPNPTISNMNDIHDLSLKGTYSFTPYFSLYCSTNNMLFSKYDLWWGYPAQGFNIMGGLSFLF